VSSEAAVMRVVLSGNDVRQFSLTDLVRDGQTVQDVYVMSDQDILRTAFGFLDMPAPSDMQVSRPESGNILISAKAEFGKK